MKKLLIIISLFICIDIVKAETYYSDYGDWSSWSEEFKKSDDVTLVETERRFRFYNSLSNEGEYFIEGENSEDYPYIDISDYKNGSISTWNAAIPESKKNRVINKKTKYLYYRYNYEVKYIYIKNINQSNLPIGEINIYENDHEIIYSSLAQNTSQSLCNYLHNGIVEQDKYVNPDGYILIVLPVESDINTLKIKINVGTSDVNVNYVIVMTDIQDINARKKLFYNELNNNNINEYKADVFYNNGNISKELISSDVKLNNSSLFFVEEINQYNYYDIYYKYYKEVKDYSDYMINGNNKYNIQSNDYKDFYRFKTRKKIEIDNIIIERNDFLNKIKELENKLINGDNINNYNKLIDELNDYKIKVNELNIQIEDYKFKIKDSESKNYELINKYENKIFNIKNEKEFEDDSKNSDIKNSNLNYPLLNIKNNLKYIFIVPCVIIFVIVIIMFYKNKNKN